MIYLIAEIEKTGYISIRSLASITFGILYCNASLNAVCTSHDFSLLMFAKFTQSPLADNDSHCRLTPPPKKVECAN